MAPSTTTTTIIIIIIIIIILLLLLLLLLLSLETQEQDNSNVLATLVDGKCVYGCSESSNGLGAELETWDWHQEWKDNGWA